MMIKHLPEYKSIVILIPYFGQWPFWINFFLASCRTNPTIRWRIYTDCGYVNNCPPNVEIIPMSFTDYCQLVSEKLEIKFNPENSYKLCDIRPAFGLIHKEDIENYDFWAFGDMDLIYGNLRNYFTEERLSKKDLFATHARRISGHLCILRNTDEMRYAFKKIVNWQTLMTQKKHAAIDERAFSKVFLRHKNSPKWVRKLAAFFDPWLQRAEFIEAFTTPNAKINWVSSQFPTEWYWRAGRVTNNLTGKKEYPYFHFMVWKKHWPSQAIIQTHIDNDDAFCITQTGFSL